MPEVRRATSVEVEVSLEARLAGSARDVEPYRLGEFSIDVPLRLGRDDWGKVGPPKNGVGEIVIMPDLVGMLERLADALYDAARVTRERAAQMARMRAELEAEEAGRG